jgi:hypothetical protein
MKCSFFALAHALALLASGIVSSSALGQNVYGPVAFGGGQASLTPAPDYYTARFAPPEAGAPAISPMSTVVAPQPQPAAPTPAPENVAAPAPQSSGLFGDIGKGDAFTGWAGGDQCASGDCGCAANVCPRWSVWANGLFMGRNMPNREYTTYQTNNNPNQLLYFPGADWGGGFETGIAYWFGCPTGCGNGNGCGGNPYCNCCYQNGVEVVYWGLWGLDGQSGLYSGNNQLSTPYNLGFVDFNNNPGIQASDYFDNARAHRLSRHDDVNNIELNLLHIPCCNGCQNFHLMWIAGVRYFRFTDALSFGTLAGTAPSGATWGDNPADEAYLNASVQNNLVGFQVGARADYCIHQRWTIFATPKVGIYGNHVTGNNSLLTGNGVAGTFQDSGNALNFNNSQNCFSMLASLDVGFTYAIPRDRRQPSGLGRQSTASLLGRRSPVAHDQHQRRPDLARRLRWLGVPVLNLWATNTS